MLASTAVHRLPHSDIPTVSKQQNKTSNKKTLVNTPHSHEEKQATCLLFKAACLVQENSVDAPFFPTVTCSPLRATCLVPHEFSPLAIKKRLHARSFEPHTLLPRNTPPPSTGKELNPHSQQVNNFTWGTIISSVRSKVQPEICAMPKNNNFQYHMKAHGFRYR